MNWIRSAERRTYAIDRNWISRHRNVEWRTLWKDGICLAYLAFNRGIDLTQMVHELEGREDALIILLADLKKEQPGLELLLHPSRNFDTLAISPYGPDN